jgi:hypothetical protein
MVKVARTVGLVSWALEVENMKSVFEVGEAPGGDAWEKSLKEGVNCQRKVIWMEKRKKL